VIAPENKEPVYIPIYTNGRVATLIERAGSRAAAVENYGPDRIRNLVKEMPGIPLAISTITLLFIYQSVFTFLALAFGFLGIRHRGNVI
jgi:hypothetical protein